MTDRTGAVLAHADDAADTATHPSAAPAPAPAPPPSSATPLSTPAATTMRHSSAANARPLTGFERWASRASDSQFNALSGSIGGFTSGVVVCPLDVIKTKLQAQGGFYGQAGQPSHHRLYNGLVGTAKVIWRDEGLRGMYRGLGPIILGYLPTWAVWFTVYNKSKVWMGERSHNTFFVSFYSSIVAGASSTVVTNPIWVIKTRLMSQMPSGGARTGFSVFPKGTTTPTSRPTLHTPWHYRSTLDAARTMYTTEGVLSFYSGLTPALLGLTHVAVQFPAYEYLKMRFTGQGMGGLSVAAADDDVDMDDADARASAPAHWIGVLSATILSKILASSLTYPHEVIRTRLQTQRRGAGATTAGTGTGTGTAAPSEPRYKGVIKTFRTILREEGWRAFYAGLGTNMMRAVPAATVTMMTYETVMRKLKRQRRDAQRRLQAQA